MRVWRLTKERYKTTAYNGRGGLFDGGRWVYTGYPVIYTSENPALAVVENIVNAEPGERVGRYWLVPADIPDDLELAQVFEADLPDDWRKTRRYPECREIGTGWIVAGETVGLIVPSAVVPQNRNILLNPAHPSFRQIEILDAIEYHFDERLTE